MRNVHHHGCQERVKYSEYFREGWTFHGKGEQNLETQNLENKHFGIQMCEEFLVVVT